MSEPVQSIERAFTLLELLGNADQCLGISELAERSQLPLGTTHRLLNTLLRLQYVEQDPDTHKYMLGLRMLHMRGAVIGQLNLAVLAMPVMKALMHQVDETVHLAVLNDGEIVYIERVEGARTHGMYTRIGKRWYAHCTALGKVMLAHMSDSVWRQVVAQRGLPRLSPKTITAPDAFEQELHRIRQRGYAIDDSEGGEAVRCVAAPIRDYRGDVIAAISISGPEKQVHPGRDAELSEAVCRAAKLISARLGYVDG
ncbi:MAG: IclR family transcriptional regulator [Anaerolineae bacterium]|nr:IclR family transcriptional regulator [Anaerolineae bacterium]